jgi:hypothetical protein
MGQEVVFAAAANLVSTSESDSICIPVGRNALLAMGVKWYAQLSAALYAELQKRLEAAVASEPTDPEELLSAAQGVIETLPVRAN